MKTKFGRTVAGAVAFCMVLATVLALPFGFLLPASAAEADYTFPSGAVLITSEHDGKNILIQNGVFSVTVSGAKNVTLMFENVTIDRRYSSDSAVTDSSIYTVASSLGWRSGTTYYAPTCPLLITNNSEVTVAFRGVNNFYAGTNRCTVTNSGTYTPVQSGMGFAGVQVDSGSTLTIEQSNGVLNAYGGYYVATDNSNNVPNGTLFNGDDNGYGYPLGIKPNETGGGAGIGGGAIYSNTYAANKTYTAGTPGTIIINGGTINAYGGHQAAGIGGGLNSAATSSSITINGGTVTARGGRWAAGIGDGDSLQNSYSNAYNNNYSINITGGTVKAVGGVACSGIGATDSISGGKSGGQVITPSVSGMSIRITGGTIDACSGYPEGFNPSSGTDYTGTDAAAAIGAGNNTRMEAQSIYISSGVKIIATSFGHYAITENGVKHDEIPQVSIEQGRMYNGRFPKLTSSEDRTFRLLEAQREDILVNGKVGNYLKFITQPEDGTAGEVYYYDSDEFVLLNADKTVYPLPEDFEARRTELLKFFEDNNMTLYADEQSIQIETVVARKHFKSIAITLPDPALHGGVYALEIPTSQLINRPEGLSENQEKITITITATTTGNIWGEIDYPFNYNMRLDAVSSSFANLDVYPDETWRGRDDGLIGEKFSESLFAYTVYIDSNATEVYLYAMFVKETGINYTIKLDNVEQTVIDEVRTDVTNVNLGYVMIPISMKGVNQKVLQLEKQDVNTADNVTAHSIIYKITIIRKATYHISLKDLSKTYDGNKVVPVIEAVRTGSGATAEDVVVTDEELKSATFTYGKGTTTGLTDAPKDAGSYTVTATINAESYTATGTATFSIAKKQLKITRIENYLLYVNSSDYETWKNDGTHPIATPGAIFLSGLVSGESVTLEHGNVYYNNLSIGYGANKITLEGVTLSGDAAKNYVTDAVQTVFGQITYTLNGSIFRSKDGTSWDKFYPTDSDTPVNKTNADYHSPVNADGAYTSHAEYVWARTQGGGTSQAVYAMEVEFGAMYFNYTKEVWNTTSMKYEQAEDGQSFWVGFDGTNNRVTVTNRSNVDIYCNVEPSISFIYASHDNGASGILATVYTTETPSDNSLVKKTDLIRVPKATPPERIVTGAEKGTPTQQSFYLILSGNPQSGNPDYIAVGDMTVTFRKSAD